MFTRPHAVTAIALTGLCQMFHTLTYAGIALFLPLIRQDLQISFTQAGMLAVSATASYAMGQVPAGYLTDRFGPKRLFVMGLLGWSTMTLSLATLHSMWAIVANQFVAGGFRALLFVPGMTIFSSWFPPERRATALSLYTVGGFAGNIVLALTGPLLAGRIGWRTTFIGFSVLGILAALTYAAFAKEAARRQKKERIALPDVLHLFKHRILSVCSAIQFIRLAVVASFNFWLPSLLLADRGLSLQAAGLVTAMSAACVAPSNALGGYVSDRIRNPPLVIGASLGLLACTSVLLAFVESVPVLLAVVAVNAVFMQFYFSPLFLVPIEVLGQRTAGMATGVNNLFANVGALSSAYALGVVKDKAGSFAWGFAGIGALCLVGVALSIILARMRKRTLSRQAAAPPVAVGTVVRAP